MRGCLGMMSLMGIMFCGVAILSVWGCIPDSNTPYVPPGYMNDYIMTDEYRMNEVERKFEMLENNKTY